MSVLPTCSVSTLTALEPNAMGYPHSPALHQEQQLQEQTIQCKSMSLKPVLRDPPHVPCFSSLPAPCKTGGLTGDPKNPG